MIIRIALSLLVLNTVGCAANRLYEWGDYEATMYRAYKSPDEEAEFEESLVVIMTRATKKGTRVPPGIYAEYAYQLFEENKLDEAIAYLRKERDSWPESARLMIQLIEAVDREKRRRAHGGDPDAPLAWAVAPSAGFGDSNLESPLETIEDATNPPSETAKDTMESPSETAQDTMESLSDVTEDGVNGVAR